MSEKCENVEIFLKKLQCLPKKTNENFKLIKKQQKSLFNDQEIYRSSYLVQSSFHDRLPTQKINSQLITDDYNVLKHTGLCLVQIIGFVVFVIILFKKNDQLNKIDEKPLRKRRICSMGPLTNTNLEFLMPEQQIIGFDINMYC